MYLSFLYLHRKTTAMTLEWWQSKSKFFFILQLTVIMKLLCILVISVTKELPASQDSHSYSSSQNEKGIKNNWVYLINNIWNKLSKILNSFLLYVEALDKYLKQGVNSNIMLLVSRGQTHYLLLLLVMMALVHKTSSKRMYIVHTVKIYVNVKTMHT